tara:strand:- start:3113 stop:3373 length:261 start_codon:yes stop_codon:yes gene_type:complete
MKEVESYEKLLARFTKRQTQLEMRQVELEEAHLEYVKLDRDLDRLEGSIQAIEYVAYGKMPGDGNHDQFKAHKPVPQQISDLDALG